MGEFFTTDDISEPTWSSYYLNSSGNYVTTGYYNESGSSGYAGGGMSIYWYHYKLQSI